MRSFRAYLWLSTSLIVPTALAEAPPVLGQYGDTGIVDTPYALMPEVGETSFTFFDTGTSSGQALYFQAGKPLSIGTIFTGFDSEEFDSDQSVDLRLQLYDGNAGPALAMGIRDVAGTGPRSSEYLVATDTYGDFTFSLGAGWGDLVGEAGNNGRPAINSHEFSNSHYFSGDAYGFGGISWATPFEGLRLGAEYIDKADDPATQYALSYRRSERFGVGAYARDDGEIGLGLTFGGNPNRSVTPQNIGTPPLAVMPRATLGLVDMNTAWAAAPHASENLVESLEDILEEEKIKLRALDAKATRIDVHIDIPNTPYYPRVIGRIARVLSMNAPASVEKFAVTLINDRGIPTETVVIDRKTFESTIDSYDRASTLWASTVFEDGALPARSGIYTNPKTVDHFRYNFGIDTDFDVSDFGGMDLRPYLYASYYFTDGLAINSRTVMNLTKPSLDPDGYDPDTVREDTALYRQNFIDIDRLTLDYFFKIHPAIYGRLSGGYLERLYAGLNTELIYAPPHSALAYGVDLSYVNKRDPDSYLGWTDRDYTTGHGTLYWDTGWNGVESSLSYGRFLAGDWGSTFTLAREFANGWRVEGSVTATDYFNESRDTRDLVPAFAITIPMQWTWPSETDSKTTIALNHSGSDVGARVHYANSLYPMIRDYDQNSYKLRWGEVWQ